MNVLLSLLVYLQLEEDSEVIERCVELFEMLIEQVIWLIGVVLPPDSPVDFLIIGLVLYLILR